jgi:type III pantothenate kinase
MNLALDFGNTRIKAGLFKQSGLSETLLFQSEAELLENLASFSEVKNCIISAVTDNYQEVMASISKQAHVLLFTSNTPVPLTNLYKSAATLGSDRIAASVGAFTIWPKHNVLTIDAGTCIKYNFVNANNEFLGGAIAPGINMRLKAMHQFTHALPLIPPQSDYKQLIGTNTHESLLSGSVFAAACEAESMISKYSQNYNDLKVVITGGDAAYLCKQLKNPFFANQNLILKGLNAIMNYNLEK